MHILHSILVVTASTLLGTSALAQEQEPIVIPGSIQERIAQDQASADQLMTEMSEVYQCCRVVPTFQDDVEKLLQRIPGEASLIYRDVLKYAPENPTDLTLVELADEEVHALGRREQFHAQQPHAAWSMPSILFLGQIRLDTQSAALAVTEAFQENARNEDKASAVAYLHYIMRVNEIRLKLFDLLNDNCPYTDSELFRQYVHDMLSSTPDLVQTQSTCAQHSTNSCTGTDEPFNLSTQEE